MTAIFLEMSLHSKMLYAYQQSCERFLVQISLTVKLSDKHSLYVKLTSGFECPPILPECGFVKVRITGDSGFEMPLFPVHSESIAVR
ncbi:hypothetical protein AVEN_4817-1 [Araneus ventricosus]|uniref:Uncharacterized protein n=1 Tax=Araneus ventricosus TaxID=182803 RepID=A0A4Y2GB90_ARAVE|nr:hypothetical protein AVEN_4817-1 [Araneus ventricosus]